LGAAFLVFGFAADFLAAGFFAAGFFAADFFGAALVAVTYDRRNEKARLD
jgi:hypothetical protein